MKFKNPYINRSLKVLKNNNIDIDIINIEYNKIIASPIVNGSVYHIKRDIIEVSYNKEIYKFSYIFK